MSDPQAIAKQFTTFYYGALDTNPSELGPVYRPTSMLSREGNLHQGVTAILAELGPTDPSQKVKHHVSTVDAQPSSTSVPNIIVSVTGLLLIGDSSNPLNFSQVFHLISEGGSYYVLNDIFRLNLG
ncbi:nuclear transport factor 2 [Coprinopsis sp. MPI-PUGE-AT-0042]|nr:nuclear transport factor 2 [Coprinopsis sp. MPI-PUGE-AT-0042]